ncbi:MAG: ABC transporter ATP-binding protein/permease [Bdellovibrionaceae bacterium]|nr:ABC transporter ATP-binding protein/permease [Pseudobdellovibrionaceae bacterium]
MTPSLLNHPFWFFIKKHKKNFNLGIMTLLLTNAFDVAGPYFIGKTIDLIMQTDRTGFSTYIVMLILIALGTAVFRYLWRIYFSRFHQQVAADLRNILFKKMLRLKVSEHQRTATGEKMTLLTQDIDNFRMGIGPGILIFFDALIYVACLLPLMLTISWVWTWKCLIFMPLIPFFTYGLEKSFSKRYRALQDETGELTSFAQETVSGIKVIKSLSLQGFRSKVFFPINSKLQDYGLRVDRIEAAFSPTLEFFVMIGTATLLFFGSQDVIRGEVTLGEFFAFYQYLLRMIWPMTAFGLSFMMYKEAASSFDRIKETLDSEQEMPPGHVKTQKGYSLKVEGLKFNYPSSLSYALYDINFELKPNESMAIVGPVGCGKSTLSQILSRSLVFDQGQVLYGHTPILEIQKEQYRNVITLVPQDVFLFKNSIKGNLTHFHNVSEESLQKFVSQVEMTDEIAQTSMGYETPLQEKGLGLSGGQRQRLTLARGLIAQPQWLILDDSLSAVDISTEQKIMGTLRGLKNSNFMNFIICSHRIQNIDWVDKILVLNQGRIEDIGSHQELIERCALYQNLYASHKNGHKMGATHE